MRGTKDRLAVCKSKIKRLTSCHTPKSDKSLLSRTSLRPLTPILHIPNISKQALRRWLDARDAYVGDQYPYVLEKWEHKHRCHRYCRHPQKSKAGAKKIIHYDDTLSDHFHVAKRISSGRQDPLNHNKYFIRPVSYSEINLRQSISLLKRIKTQGQLSGHLLSHLLLGEQEQTVTKNIHDSFDDKSVGVDINEATLLRTNVEQHDQAIQVNLVCPQIELHYEFDTSVVDGEEEQRTRSVRRGVEYSDKVTETDFVLNFANVENKRKEEQEENQFVAGDDEDGKVILCDVEEKGEEDEDDEIDPYIERYNVEQQQLPEMSDVTDQKPKKKKFIQSLKFTHTGNRILPLTNLFSRLHTDTNNNDKNNSNDKQNRSKLTMPIPRESLIISIHKQFQR